MPGGLAKGDIARFNPGGLAGVYAPKIRLTAREASTAIIGGLLMGYGARLAYGCNIGGFVGGVVSGSLHGWWWLLFGFLGSGAGVWACAAKASRTPAATSGSAWSSRMLLALGNQTRERAAFCVEEVGLLHRHRQR